jgi:lariat debranching enzyme
MATNIELKEENGVRLAIEGCGHGTLHAIYASIEQACKIKGWPGVDLLIIGGDFQSVRNAYDLNCVAMPAKYREMCDFHEYYSGAREAPYLTVFVGGNHEASNYLFELYYGGWVAKNIYYMGAASVVRLGPLRIAGLSGIWKSYNFRKPHYERLPYNESDMKSIYHVREIDVRKLQQVRAQVDVGISHDWPRGVEWKGDWKKLFRQKAHLEEDARSGQLGSVAAKLVVDRLKPRWWFSAHLHCKFAGVIDHNEGGLESKGDLPRAAPAHAQAAPPKPVVAKNEDEIDLDLDDEPEEKPIVKTEPAPAVPHVNADEIDLELEDDEDGVAPVAPGQGLDGVQVPVSNGQQTPQTVPDSTVDIEAARAALPDSFKNTRSNPPPAEDPPGITNRTTQFLALDKCMPNRSFLQLMTIPSAESSSDSSETELARPLRLEHDKEWLAITRAFALHEPLLLGDPKFHTPRAKQPHEYAALIDESLAWIEANQLDLRIPEDFEPTAPVYDGGNFRLPQYERDAGGLKEYSNPQTTRFCRMLGIANPFDISEEERQARLLAGPRPDEHERPLGGGRGGRGGGRGGGGGRGRGGRGGGGGRGRGGRGGSRGRGG